MLRSVTAKIGAFALSHFRDLAQFAIEIKVAGAEGLARTLIHEQFPADALIGEEQLG